MTGYSAAEKNKVAKNVEDIQTLVKNTNKISENVEQLTKSLSILTDSHKELVKINNVDHFQQTLTDMSSMYTNVVKFQKTYNAEREPVFKSIEKVANIATKNNEDMVAVCQHIDRLAKTVTQNREAIRQKTRHEITENIRTAGVTLMFSRIPDNTLVDDYQTDFMTYIRQTIPTVHDEISHPEVRDVRFDLKNPQKPVAYVNCHTRTRANRAGVSVCHNTVDSASVFMEVENGLVVFMEIKDDQKI